MRTETKLFAVLVFFFIPISIVYGQLTHWQELTGPVALLLTGLFFGMISVYLSYTARKLPPRPEDDPSAVIADGAGDYGIFVAQSWWPLFLAGSGAIVFAGLAVGWWLTIIGAALLAVSVIGWTFESFKGEHAL